MIPFDPSIETREEATHRVMEMDERRTLARLGVLKRAIARNSNKQLIARLHLEEAELKLSLSVLQRAKKRLAAEIETRQRENR